MPYVATLNESDLKFGKQVAEQLKAAAFPFDGVFWLFDEAADDWRLVIVTRLVDQEGRRETYLRLGHVVSGLSRSETQSLSITVMSPQTTLFTALKKRYSDRGNIEGVRLHHEVINRVMVPAAYLYEIH